MTYDFKGSPISMGTVLQLDEPDYLYGAGALTLRVTQAPHDRDVSGGEWMRVTGVEIDWRGGEIVRTVMVKVTAAAQSAAQG